VNLDPVTSRQECGEAETKSWQLATLKRARLRWDEAKTYRNDPAQEQSESKPSSNSSSCTGEFCNRGRLMVSQRRRLADSQPETEVGTILELKG
jgi:hypothetical protein